MLPTKIAALVVSAIQDLRETKGSTPSKIIGYISYVSEMNDDKVKRQVSDILSSEMIIKPLLFADYSQLFNRVYIKLPRSLLSLLARKSQRARTKNEQVGSLVVVPFRHAFYHPSNRKAFEFELEFRILFIKEKFVFAESFLSLFLSLSFILRVLHICIYIM